jgi:hypothetical protein
LRRIEYQLVIIGGHKMGDRLVHQQDTPFYAREGREKGIGTSVRRTIEFVPGPPEVRIQGTDGLQYYESKSF